MQKSAYTDDSHSKGAKSSLVVNLFCFTNGTAVQRKLSWVASCLNQRGVKTFYCKLPPSVELSVATLREVTPEYDVVLVDNPILHKAWDVQKGIQPAAKRTTDEFNELYFVLYDGLHDPWSGRVANEFRKIGVDYDVVKEAEGFSVTEGYGKVVQAVLNELAQQVA